MKNSRIIGMMIGWGMFSLMWAQTESLSVAWDPNSEPDMAVYRLQRSVNSTSNFVFFREVDHPTTRIADTDVSPGNRYAYRIAAVDGNGNASGYSAPVSAGIPRVDLAPGSVPGGSDTTLSKATFLSDPDDEVTALQITISQEENVSVTVGNNSITLSPSPGSYTGPASFTLRAEDDQGFYDLQTVQFVFSDGNSSGNSPPRLTFSGTLSVAEDSSLTLALRDLATDPDHSFSQLSWQVEAGDHLSARYDQSSETVTVVPDPDWFGESRVTVVVSDPGGLSDQETLAVLVAGRNDIRNFSVRTLSETQAQIRFGSDFPSQISFQYWQGQSPRYLFSQSGFRTQHELILDSLTAQTTYQYRLTATDENGFTLMVRDSLVHRGSSDAPPAADRLVVYPNPIKPSRGHNEMIFTNLPSQTYSIGLYSLTGQKIHEEELAQVAASEHRINVVQRAAEMPSGVYVYMVKNEKAQILESGRVVIVR